MLHWNRTGLLKQADAIVGSVLCRLLGWWDYRRRQGRPVLDPPPEAVKRILVVRPGGIGDMVILLPVLSWLHNRYPEAEIDLACESRNRAVAGLADVSPRVLVYDSSPFAFLRHLRRQNYDLAVDTEQFHNFSAIFAWLSGAKTRIGFKINPRRNALYTHLVDYAVDGPEVGQFARLLAPLGGEGASFSRVGCLDGTHLSVPVEFDRELGSTLGEMPFVVVHLGSSTPYKRWPPERYASTVVDLHKERGMGAVLVGGKRDGDSTREVAAALREAGVPFCSMTGRLELGESAALVSQAALFLGPDSGLAHLAVAFDVPSVVLFGPSDPRKWGESNGRQDVAQVSLPCSPCFIFGYAKPCRTHDCMQRIEVEQVLDACRGVMDAG